MPYQLSVAITLRQVTEHGGYTGPNELRVEETATLGQLDFAQVAEILGKFHTLTESIREPS